MPRRHKVLTHGQERLFCKVISVSIHSWTDFLLCIATRKLTFKEVNHIRRSAIDISNDLILLSCRLAMEHLCVIYMKTEVGILKSVKIPRGNQKA